MRSRQRGVLGRWPPRGVWQRELDVFLRRLPLQLLPQPDQKLFPVLAAVLQPLCLQLHHPARRIHCEARELGVRRGGGRAAGAVARNVRACRPTHFS